MLGTQWEMIPADALGDEEKMRFSEQVRGWVKVEVSDGGMAQIVGAPAYQALRSWVQTPITTKINKCRILENANDRVQREWKWSLGTVLFVTYFQKQRW